MHLSSDPVAYITSLTRFIGYYDINLHVPGFSVAAPWAIIWFSDENGSKVLIYIFHVNKNNEWFFS